MITTLENIGIGPRMVRWVKVLYSHPTVAKVVKINGRLPSTFEMKNGTRQGCPLSPHLFVISLEPLLATIKINVDISGLKIGEEEHKIAAYADDVLCYITNPRITLPNLVKELKKYGELSNLKINPIKSEILNINIDKEKQALQGEFPFIWGKTENCYHVIFPSRRHITG